MPDKDDERPPSRADAVRGAAVQAFQATAGQAGVTRERAQELADELASAAGRVMAALDELRPATADDLRSLRADLRDLDRRVAALEAAAGTTAGPQAKRPAARTGATAKAATTRTAAAKESAKKKAPAKQPAGEKSSPARRRAPRSST
jgi:polyhydroxyalkanoate synthesis regulator phasin